MLKGCVSILDTLPTISFLSWTGWLLNWSTWCWLNKQDYSQETTQASKIFFLWGPNTGLLCTVTLCHPHEHSILLSSQQHGLQLYKIISCAELRKFFCFCLVSCQFSSVLFDLESKNLSNWNHYFRIYTTSLSEFSHNICLLEIVSLNSSSWP